MPDHFDRLLHQALSSRAAAPERPGLDSRIQARIAHKLSGAAPGEHRLRRPYWLAAALSVAFLSLALLVLCPPVRIPTPSRPQPPASPIVATVSISAPTPIPAGVATRVRHRPRPALPKLPVFPAPRPLSLEERALLSIAHAEPAQLAALSKPVTPLKIEPLHIELLEKGEN